jgi:DNA-directed RNA polymerase subunit H (RpoH/RPB5)
MLVTGPTISRPAGLVAYENGIEFIHEGLYAFDRMKSSSVPNYEIMDISTIIETETRHKCPHTQWPTMRSDDPIAIYMGFQPGTCLLIRNGFYIQNLRHVIKV